MTEDARRLPRRAELGDVRLHYIEAGDTGQPVVLLRGWPQTRFSWRDVIPLLATQHRGGPSRLG